VTPSTQNQTDLPVGFDENGSIEKRKKKEEREKIVKMKEREKK
jgi:hypothetical protein